MDIVFKLASVQQFLDLKRKYPEFEHGYPLDWSLKELGYLFTYDTVKKFGARRVLEVGPGYSDVLCNRFLSQGIEYWYCDKADSSSGIKSDIDRWNRVAESRSNSGARFVSAFLGEFNHDIPDNYFDAVVSVSVIEHIEDNNFGRVVEDMYRVLKRGGRSIHSVDCYYGSKKGDLWHRHIISNGFEVPEPYWNNWCFSGDNTTFLEQQKIRYLIYNGIKDMRNSNVKYVTQFATVLHDAMKL